MDEQTLTVLNATRAHTARVLSEQGINTLAPQVYLLGTALNQQGVACQLVARALHSQEDWGRSFNVSTMVVALGFPGGEVITYEGLEGWSTIQTHAESEVIYSVGALPERCEWADVSMDQLQSMMSKELRDVGDGKLTNLCQEIVASVEAELLQWETPIVNHLNKSGFLRL